jgi:hypothetical protein
MMMITKNLMLSFKNGCIILQTQQSDNKSTCIEAITI